ncbi:LacI family DNA-binding transcriptional regulator [Burkholderia thailandensis]|uniref:Periplasmic binding and sugar binding domain of LacI family protein n=3 Tax=Burkholderia thailandensis TaxID=57975 RepID=A0AAW9CQV8_BURTH|nr:LacI family DNA-binding transcriptional regulator [Burkholderia thailandensis]AHI68132.1 periplasmic binding s and sugar binding domain of LacI family protein [Burkholderia thailandensis H0587]AHI81268.1 periplasmic binding s and sugar binding domain of LacI family protein [Burkholderia thailandensis E444]AIP65053.1 LacI family transcriptional regulator [Burkholderia thailandensis]AJY32882.1 bacterial regulatory s, lacI family protein [Burkholderia thailandensis 34]AOI54541.1 LacI family tr
MALRIKDVAEAAGVSVATVSRVLSNSGPVRDTVRRRVLEVIERLDYRPNAAARRLRSGDTATIGLIVSDVRNPFFTEVSRAVEDAAYAQGMRVILCNTDESPEKEAMYLRLMESERVTGVIYSPTYDAARRFDARAHAFPVVMIDRAGPAGAADAVTLDNRDAATRLVEHLVERGYRRVAGLFGNASTTGRERHAAFVDALRRHALPADAEFVDPHPQAAHARVHAWLAGDAAARPDAIVASNGLLLLGAYRALREHGARVPDDVALAGFDNDAWTELVTPGVTVIAQPVYEIGKNAMQLLTQRLADPAMSARTLVLPGELIVRGSTAARAAG